MPVDIGITTAGGDTLVVVWVDEAHEEFLITLGSRPLGVELDPDNWIMDTSVDLTSGVGPRDVAPMGLRLEAAPNPFTGSTTVRFAVSRRQAVEIDIFSAAGRKVQTLMDGEAAAGWNESAWDGCDGAGRPVAPGTYFCRITAEEGTRSTRIVHLR
jgi:hypothetical protein